MKIKFIWLNLLVATLFLTSFTQCSSSKTNKKQMVMELEDKPSFVLGDVFFQKWIAGVQGGGSGYHFYLMVKENKRHVVFDSVYFRGLKAKLELGKMGYIASFKTDLNQKKDLKMSGNTLDEYGNEFPHELQENQCVLSYYEKGRIKYYKIENLVEKQAEYYPSTPPNQQ